MSNERIQPERGWAQKADGHCRRCGQPVPRGRSTFCSDHCVYEWKVRTQPGYVRRMLAARDYGVCRQCGLDCQRTTNFLTRHPHPMDFRVPAVAVPRDRFGEIARSWGMTFSQARGTMPLWAADHVVEVRHGGGECGLDNFQTLCWNCHRLKTNRNNPRRRVRPEPRVMFRYSVFPLLPVLWI